MYYKLFEEDLQIEIPEKLYINKPKQVVEIWFNALNREENSAIAKYLKQKYNLKVDEIDRFEFYKEKYYDEIVEKSNSVSEIREAIANMFGNCNIIELQQFFIQKIYIKQK